MLTSLSFTLDKEVVFDSFNDKILVVEDMRDNIIKACQNEPESVFMTINNQSHEMSHIIYAKPHKNIIKIYGIGDSGIYALNAVFKNMLIKGTFLIKNEVYRIVGTPVIENNLDFLPYNNGKITTYTTITPINIFNKHNHKVFKSILHKHFTDGKYDSGKKDSVVGFYNDIKQYANEQIKDCVAYVASKTLGKEKSYFQFVDNIKIDWEDIRVSHQRYHSEERNMPMILGKFKSNFVLPKFIGYKIGKGFGELQIKNNYERI